jgi:formylglycine-generating enzyme required for sulfatase activity/serine/threonine protein kinase
VANEQRNALSAGYQLGEFTIERVLGAGGFGIAYLATEAGLDRRVAIKEYLPRHLALRGENGTSVHSVSADEVGDYQYGLQRFREEAKALVAFRHPNIVAVHRFMEANGTAYLVMEYVDGRSLGELLGQDETLSEDEIREIAFPLMNGLEQVHETGFLHRDIKPHNIFIEHNGNPVLIDFGAARMALGVHTQALTGVITIGYSPFEQYSKRGKQGPWTDIYSLGATLYRCMTGHKPSEATDRIAEEDYEPVAQTVPGMFSEELCRAVDAALMLKGADRPQSVAEWRALFITAGDGGTIPTSRAGAAPPQAPPPAPQPLKPEGERSTAPLHRLSPEAGGPRPAAEEGEQAPGGPRPAAEEGEQAPGGPRPAAEEGGQAPGGPRPAAEEGGQAPGSPRPAAEEGGQAPGGPRPAAEEGGQATGGPRPAAEEGGQATGGPQPAAGDHVQAAGDQTVHPGAPLIPAEDRTVRAGAPLPPQENRTIRASQPPPPAAGPAPQRKGGGGRGMLISLVVILVLAGAGAGAWFGFGPEILAMIDGKGAGGTTVATGPGTGTTTPGTTAPVVAGPKPGTVVQDCAACPQLIVLPAGAFTMGSPTNEPGREKAEGPQHRVVIPRKLAFGRFEVTFAEWDACVKAGGCGRYRPADKGWGRGARPVVNVSWHNARAYAAWLSKRTGKRYRLPSEAEWEYAARGGTTALRYWHGKRGGTPANCKDCRSTWSNKTTAPVGKFAKNPFGLYDMMGNVWEWVGDCWTDTYDGRTADAGPVTPRGACAYRVTRGGSYLTPVKDLRSAMRSGDKPGARDFATGFRVVREVE